MKKVVYVFTIMVTFNFSFSQSIHGIVTYQATLDTKDYMTNINNDAGMPETRKKSLTQRALGAVPTNFYLIFDANESLYKAEHDMETNRKLGLLLNQTGNVGRHDFLYYTNKESNDSFYQSFWTQEVLVNMDKVNWTLTQETKKIGEYTCYKAIAKIDTEQTVGMNFVSPVIAWYTPQIPVQVGIQNFNGLPGLTLELTAEFENGKIHYNAIKIELNPKQQIKIAKPKGKKLISEREYVELIKSMNSGRKKS